MCEVCVWVLANGIATCQPRSQLYRPLVYNRRPGMRPRIALGGRQGRVVLSADFGAAPPLELMVLGHGAASLLELGARSAEGPSERRRRSALVPGGKRLASSMGPLGPLLRSLDRKAARV